MQKLLIKSAVPFLGALAFIGLAAQSSSTALAAGRHNPVSETDFEDRPSHRGHGAGSNPWDAPYEVDSPYRGGAGMQGARAVGTGYPASASNLQWFPLYRWFHER